MKKFLSTFITLWVVWVLLAGFDLIEIVVGGVAAFVLASIMVRLVDYSFDFSIFSRLIKFIIFYLPVFIYQLILANLDMAYRVLSPSLPIKPGFVKIPTKLKSSFGKFVLANSITLTPGTVSVDVDGEYIYVHWVNVQGKLAEDYKKNVSESFEKILGGIFH